MNIIDVPDTLHFTSSYQKNSRRSIYKKGLSTSKPSSRVANKSSPYQSFRVQSKSIRRVHLDPNMIRQNKFSDFDQNLCPSLQNFHNFENSQPNVAQVQLKQTRGSRHSTIKQWIKHNDRSKMYSRLAKSVGRSHLKPTT